MKKLKHTDTVVKERNDCVSTLKNIIISRFSRKTLLSLNLLDARLSYIQLGYLIYILTSMKNIRFLMVLVVALLSGVQPFFAQTNAEKEAKEKQVVKELLESSRYKIEVDRMVPMSGPSKHLTSPYSLELKGDSISSYLPYFGQAYSLPYGGGKGLIFDAPITDYKLAFNKKKEVATVKFKCKTEEDNFTYIIEVYSNGSSTIRIQPVNRQSISFYGELMHNRD